MEYTLNQLLENVQFTDFVNLDKHLKNITNPKNGSFATISDVVTEDVCKYFVINIHIPSKKYIEDNFYQWHTREDIENYIQSCYSMRKAVIVFNPAGSTHQAKNENGIYTWCADDSYEFYGYKYNTDKWTGGISFCKFRHWKKDDEITHLWDRTNEKYWNPAKLHYSALDETINIRYTHCVTRVFDNADEMLEVSKTIYKTVNDIINEIIEDKKNKLTETYNQQINKLNVLINNER